MAAAPGYYKQSIGGYRTFIPDALPPPLSLTPALQRSIEDATHLLGQVQMCRTVVPNVNLLLYSSLRREALASSTIEGTIASADELIRFQVADQSERQAVREVANYAHALEWGCEQLTTRPLAVNLILGLHERLLAGVRGAGRAGQFKSGQNHIAGGSSLAIEDAMFVPPPPEETLKLMTGLEGYINGDNIEPRIVQCAIGHYQFETIHPFHDGNGRVGRLLIILQMIQLGLLSAPLIYPSVYFERRRDEYYARLQAVRDKGEWLEWIAFFTSAIKHQCEETIAWSHKILELRDKLRQDIRDTRRRASLSAVLDVFFIEPAQSIREIAEFANIAYNSVQIALNDLQSMGLVYEMTGKQKGRIYVCRPVMDAIFGPIQ